MLNDPDQKPGGAIIVGLGKAGELSPRKLTQAFANAMREYGIVMAESNRLGEGAELAVTTLLIGAGGMGLSVANSIDAILNGVLQANKTFSQMEDRLHQRVVGQDEALLWASPEQLQGMLAELAREPVTRRLPLRGLGEREVAAYVELTASEIASSELVAALHEETEGNPLFVEETVRMLAVGIVAIGLVALVIIVVGTSELAERAAAAEASVAGSTASP